jgi:hypothetical protein
VSLLFPPRLRVEKTLSPTSRLSTPAAPASQRPERPPDGYGANAPGNVPLTSRHTGLPKDSGANVPQTVSPDNDFPTELVGKVPRVKLELILSGIDVVPGKV